MQVTESLYLGDSYQTTFHARVEQVRDKNIFLDRTLFHPRSDSQMSDRGFLSAFGDIFPILAVERRGRIIAHTVDRPPPKVGQPVEGRVDWDFRYQMMRMHTALHIAAAILREHYRAEVTMTHVHPEWARVGVSLADVSDADVRDIERRVNIIVDGGYPVRVRHLARHETTRIPAVERANTDTERTRAELLRAIEIVGVDFRVDDGTHVANTFEVRGVSLTAAHGRSRTGSQLDMRLTPVH